VRFPDHFEEGALAQFRFHRIEVFVDAFVFGVAPVIECEMLMT
jgi:hypothetical protein